MEKENVNSIRDLYDLVLQEYGKRGCWISELADKLCVCKTDANYLTYALGYRRGKAFALAAYEEFAKDEGVRAIFDDIMLAQ